MSSNETESDVFEWLLFDFGWPESVVQVIDDVAAFGCLLSGIWLLMPVVVALLSQAKKGTGPNLVDANFPSGSLGLDRMFKFTEVGSLLAVTIWVCLMATATSIRGGIYSELMFGEVAVGNHCASRFDFCYCVGGLNQQKHFGYCGFRLQRLLRFMATKPSCTMDLLSI